MTKGHNTMDIFGANDFRTFVNNNVTDEQLKEQVATMTNKHLEEVIIPHIDRKALNEVIVQAFYDTINEIENDEQ